MKRTESIADFIARGGSITRVPAPQASTKVESIKSTTGGGPAVIMTMDDADLYYGEHKARKARKKAKSTIDLSALPEELRRKYVDEVISGQEDEDGDDE